MINVEVNEADLQTLVRLQTQEITNLKLHNAALSRTISEMAEAAAESEDEPKDRPARRRAEKDKLKDAQGPGKKK